MTCENTNQSLPISAEVLGLSNVIVEDVRIDLAARKIRIRVRSTKEEIACRLCGRLTKPHGVGRTLTLRHLPILGKETYIEITPRRGRCPIVMMPPRRHSDWTGMTRTVNLPNRMSSTYYLSWSIQRWAV